MNFDTSKLEEKGYKIIRGFDLMASASVAAGGSETLETVIVPANQALALLGFANYVGDASSWGYMTWEIRENGIGAYPLIGILDQWGLQTDPRPLFEPIIINGGSEMTAVVSNSDATPRTAGVTLIGYYVGRK